MEYRVISRGCAAVLIHKGEIITPSGAAESIKSALRTCGYAPWEHMCLELFEGGESSLLLAYPAEAPEPVSPAPWAPGFIKEIFTD